MDAGHRKRAAKEKIGFKGSAFPPSPFQGFGGRATLRVNFLEYPQIVLVLVVVLVLDTKENHDYEDDKIEDQGKEIIEITKPAFKEGRCPNRNAS
jgi:hypothetical protein